MQREGRLFASALFVLRAMRVTLINYTPKPIETVFTAARTCYSSDGPTEIWNAASSSEKSERMHSLIDRVIASGHLSVLEHITFTFAVEGISRACSHQLVRHRIASFSQQSQRYVAAGDDAFVTPPSIKDNPEALRLFEKSIDAAKRAYEELMSLGIPREDARFVLPNATKTNIVMSMNFRELYQVCQIRLCARAQWEIRELFWRVKGEIKGVPELRGLAEYLQPKCVVLGYCPEHRSCGLMPPRQEVLGK